MIYDWKARMYLLFRSSLYAIVSVIGGILGIFIAYIPHYLAQVYAFPHLELYKNASWTLAQVVILVASAGILYAEWHFISGMIKLQNDERNYS